MKTLTRERATAVRRAAKPRAVGRALAAVWLIAALTMVDLTAGAAPQFTCQPTNQTVVQGSTISLVACATGNAPLAYQWMVNGSNLTDDARISGSQSNILTVAAFQASDSGNYQVIVTDDSGSVTSAPAAVAFGTTNLLINPGAETGDLYGWSIGGSSNPNVDNGSFDPGINPNSGGYDFYGGAGAAGTLSQTVGLDGNQGLTPSLIDGGGLVASLSFWEQGLDQGTPSDHASAQVVFLNADMSPLGTNTTPAIDSHSGLWQNYANLYVVPTGTRYIQYTMQFVRSFGNDNDSYIDDNSLTVSFLPTPLIATQPSDQTVLPGSNATFTVTAAGTAPLAYQWLLNGTNLTDDARVSGSQSTSLTISNALAGDAGVYQVIVSNAFGSVTSDPATLTVVPPPVLWLRADLGVTTNPSGRVAAWADQSGAGHNGSQAGPTQQPLFVSNGLGGQPVIRFGDGGNRFLSLSGQVLTSQQFTVIAVVNDTSTNTNFREIFSDWASTNTLTSVFFGVTQNSPDLARFTDYFRMTGIGVVANPSLDFIFTGVSGVSNVMTFQNEDLIASTNSPFSTRILTSPYSVGRQGSLNGEYWQGDIAELLVYNAELSGTERALVWNYLETRYGQPAFTVQPQSQTNLIGNNATLNATATCLGPLSYQWLFNGTNLPGSTNASLTIANARPENAGPYQVIVSHGSLSATSLVANLTLVGVPATITCPPDITVCNDPGACGAVVNFSTAATGNCGGATVGVSIYRGFTSLGGGAPYSDFAGAFAASGVTFGSDTAFAWHPFGLGSFGADITGILSVGTNGTYDFKLDSDDGSRFFIDGVLVVDDGGTHPPLNRTGSASLAEGFHSFEIQFYECCGGESGVDLILPPGVSYGPSVVCSPASGSVFPAGTNTVTCISTDACGSTNVCSFNVIVNDCEAPTVTLLGDNPLTNECHTAFVDPGVAAADNCPGTLTVVTNNTVNPNATGDYTIGYVATDPSGNSATNIRTVRIVDTTPPQIFCSSNLVAECTGPAGTPVAFTVTATDSCDANPSIICTPASGSSFSLGTNTVTCVATDANGNSNACSFSVTVRDTTPPQIACPPNMNVAEAPRDSGSATVTFATPQATDICDSSLLVYCEPPSGSVFPVGTNTVICTAVDDSSNTNTCQFAIRVIPYRLRVTVTSTEDSGPGTLRQAMQDANDSPDENLIVFNIPDPNHTIHLLTPLPAQTSPVIIDGWTQPGFADSPLVELDGSGATNVGGIDGLVILAGGSTIRGLTLHGFATALRIGTNGNNVIKGNFIGTDRTGTNAPGNSGDGIWVNSGGNTIGGTTHPERNVLCGNAGNGIVFSSSSVNVIQGNFIGVAADGVTALGNGQSGVLFEDQAAQNLVGGTTNGCANNISFNGHNGITLAASAGAGNTLLGNAIFANLALGIDLGDDGVTPNNANDTESGPNKYRNYPVLTDAQSINGTTTIYGQLQTAHNTTYLVQFFLNDTADPSGYGEGQVYLGSTYVTVNGSGAATFTAAFPVTATYTQFVTATATDPENNTSEFSQAVQVRTPPVLGAQPVSSIAPAGTPATFCSTVTGTFPIFYQWRLNGFNIPGATNACYTVSAADVTNGGTYTVVVGNVLGALATIPASLTLPLVNSPGGDNFADRVSLQGLSGLVGGSNARATFEPGEPFHAGKFGGKSAWYTWQAPVTGVATFRTTGSTFDTLLGIYSGTAISNLVELASDNDSGGFYTSLARFDVVKSDRIQIAIDGSDGASGDYVLAWSEEDTSHLAPFFILQPLSQTVATGSNVTFTAVAVRVCGHGEHNCPDPTHYPEGTLPGLSYQWYFFGSPIPGATSNSITIPHATPDNLGVYTLRVSTLWQTTESAEAVLQFNATGSDIQPIQAVDKLQDTSNPLLLGVTTGTSTLGNVSPADAVQQEPLGGGTSVVRGYTGTQIFNTTGSATSPGEVICGVIGGASEWISVVAEESGTLFVDTDGSTYDTVIAVYRRSPTNSAVLELLGCDNNSGTNGLTSSVAVPVVAGQTNYVDVDGVNGLTGVLQFNYSLATQTILRSAGVTPAGAQHLQVLSRTNLHFALQASTNMTAWTSLITTNAPSNVFDYIDLDSIHMPRRFYRALLLP